ncbi:MAG: RNA methyltransferase [Candidatus Helarchaeota archaeon]|nr:RNA methyltransferase [Candidatus Helarchaeota archaeon]
MEFISKNLLRFLKKLKQKKHRKSEKRFLIEGEKLIKEALNSDAEIESVICSIEFFGKKSPLINVIKSKNINVMHIHSRDIGSITDVTTPQGIFGVIKIKEKKFNPSLLKKNAELIALDNISDAGNLGTIIRTAHWFRISGIIIGKNSIELFNPKVVRSTMGAIFHLPIWYDLDLKEKLTELKNIGYKLIAADPSGTDSIKKLNIKSSKVIILGSESKGISSDILNMCDFRIKIKGVKSFDSINLAVSAGIIMWEMKK